MGAKLNLAAGSIFETLGVLSIVGIFGAISLVVFLIVSYAVKNPKVKLFAAKVKLFFMWNFCIRYLKVTFVDMQFAAIK